MRTPKYAIGFAATILLLPAYAKEKPTHAEQKNQNMSVQLYSRMSFGDTPEPLMKLSRAVQKDQTSTSFRMTWSFSLASQGSISTVLYNREKSTLKLYSKGGEYGGLRIKHYLFTQVTDTVLQKLADKYEAGKSEYGEDIVDPLSFFGRMSEVGAKKQDLGSKLKPWK